MGLLKNKIGVAVLLIAATAAVAVRCTSRQADAATPAVTMPEATVSVERGEHLVIGGGCNDCHSPKLMTPTGPKVDSSRMLSGHPSDAKLPQINGEGLKPGNWIQFSPDLTAFIGPWGMSYSANLTSDSATGIGAWNEENFLNAIRKGKHMGFDNGRPISPPMPWDNYRNLTDDDLKSIFAFLKSTRPVSNRVHAPFSPAEVEAMANAKP